MGRHPYIGHTACSGGMRGAWVTHLSFAAYAKRTSFRASPSVALSYRKSRTNHGAPEKGASFPTLQNELDDS